jgi:hypothetical protein
VTTFGWDDGGVRALAQRGRRLRVIAAGRDRRQTGQAFEPGAAGGAAA